MKLFNQRSLFHCCLKGQPFDMTLTYCIRISFDHTASSYVMYLKFLLIILVFNVLHITAMTEQDDSSSVEWTKCMLCQETT